jgi:hypothetical protein
LIFNLRRLVETIRRLIFNLRRLIETIKRLIFNLRRLVETIRRLIFNLWRLIRTLGSMSVSIISCFFSFVNMSTVPAAGNFLTALKSYQKGAETYGFRTSLYSSRFLVGLRHPWPFDWQPGYGFRPRPLFFIQEKKRRSTPSVESKG